MNFRPRMSWLFAENLNSKIDVKVIAIESVR